MFFYSYHFLLCASLEHLWPHPDLVVIVVFTWSSRLGSLLLNHVLSCHRLLMPLFDFFLLNEKQLQKISKFYNSTIMYALKFTPHKSLVHKTYYFFPNFKISSKFFFKQNCVNLYVPYVGHVLFPSSLYWPWFHDVSQLPLTLNKI